jgi:uncharacterized membrane protein YraQ (UPF0718 family)
MSLTNEVLRVVGFVGDAIVHMLPFFLISVITAAAFSQFNFKEQMVRFVKKRIGLVILVATLIGAMSPLCSCGVIPMLFTLLHLGMPIAPIMSFWLTSPVMSPEAFLLTWGHLGMELALARLAATIFLGIAAGYVALKLFPPHQGSQIWLKPSLKKAEESCGCDSLSSPAEPKPKSSFQWKLFLVDLKKLSVFLGAWLVVAFVLEAIVTFYFPSNFIKNVFGEQNVFSVLWAAVIGIPLYINNIGAIPIVNGLLQSGMGSGAALAFLLAGPVTTIPAMIAVLGLVKKKVFFVFLTLGFSLSVLSGYLYAVISGILT